MSTGGAKRPFWMHQLVEYILCGGLVAIGTQSLTPIVPSALGAILLVYAACTKSPVAAFRLLSRRVYRFVDPLMIALLVFGAVQPWVEVDAASQVAIGGVAFVYLVVWIQSSYAERVPRSERAASRAASSVPAAAAGSATAGAAGADRSTEMGRSMGRLVGRGVAAARDAATRRQSRNDG
ncbi:MAG: hypothetical protein ACKO27_03635 [Ilumatobacteraceae bacterium]